MRPAKLCFAFPLPQLPPEQTQPLPQGGLAFPSESREDSFTPSPAANTCPRNKPSKQTATAPPLNLCRSQAPLGNASREALLRIPAPAIAPGTNTAPAARRACLSIGIPGGFFHTLSRGQHMPPQQALKTNGNSAPIKPMSFPSSAWECVPRSSASHSRSRNRPRNKHSPCRKAGLPSHRNPGRILSHPLLWSRPARRILKNPRRRISGGGLAGEKGCQIAIQHPGIPGRSSGPTIKATRNLSPPPPSPRNPPRRKTDSAPSG